MTAFARRNATRVNRREHTRMDVNLPARLVVGTTVLTGRIENISVGGVSFVTKQLEPALAVGARVTVVAPGAAENGGDIEQPSHVIRTDILDGGDGEERTYALGFERPLDDGAPHGV